MRTELFIARRIYRSGKLNSKGTRPIIQLIIAGMAIGFATMIVAMAIVTGYNKAIREKLTGFEGHISIGLYDENNSYETKPILRDEKYISEIKKMNGVVHVNEFATKACILKMNEEFKGMVAKGVGNDFDWSYFQSNLLNGKVPAYSANEKSDDIFISKNLADQLKLDVGSKVNAYFIQNPPRARAFKVIGIYSTGLEEFDNLLFFCHIDHLKKLNDWDSTQTGGYELRIDDFNHLDKISDEVYDAVPSNINASSITEKFPQIFDWLNLTDKNGVVIIVLMLLVVIINMISAIIILILERTRFIGVMKAIGTRGSSIQKIFLSIAAMMIGRGLIIGNILGIGLCLLQKYFGIIQLDQTNYYISKAPINFDWTLIIALNALVFLISLTCMLLPALMISRMTTAKILRYN